MDKRDKRNWYIVGLLIIGTIIAFSLYQFLVIIPNKNLASKQKADEITQQENCMKTGRVYADKYEADLKNSLILTKSIISPIYHFNKKLQTCLIETGENAYYSTGNFSTYKFIRDLHTNEILASQTFDEETKYNFAAQWVQDRQEYENRKAELFEQ